MYPMRLTWISILLLSLCSYITGYTQNITLKNASFEGNPGRDSLPSGWVAASNTPDLLPGVFNIKKRASHAKTYVGMHSGPGYWEGIAQQLPAAMKAGQTYSLSFDMTYAPDYVFPACYGNLTIYGGNKPGDTAQLLYQSGTFTDTAWIKKEVILKPTRNFTYLSFWADPRVPCSQSSFGCALLLDNLSEIRQQLKLDLSATPSCPRSSSGTAEVKITGGTSPFRINWTPGDYTTSTISDLSAGIYTVNVTDANGVTNSDAITIHQSTLAAKVIISAADCFGATNNSVKLDASGGTPPYSFYCDTYIKNGNNPVFSNLETGNHIIRISDNTCSDTFHVTVHTPEKLVLNTTVKPCSCSETSDGKITLNAIGGTLPYQYRLYNDPWKEDSVITNLKTGHYIYEVKDAKGCSVEGNATISSPWQNCTVVIPSAFSPNGDGNNDVFKPKIYEPVRNYQLNVFNRWGSLVYRTTDPDAGWDGSMQSTQSFIYVCTFTNRNNEQKEFKGALMLIK